MAISTPSRIITLATLALALGAPAHPSIAISRSPASAVVSEAVAPVSDPELTAPLFAVEQDAVAYRWVQGLFVAAGFQEPSVAIEFFDDEEVCGGARGRTYFDDLTTVRVCATHRNPGVQEVWRRRTLLHEMAHAWVGENVSSEDTRAFTELRGLEVWLSADVAWQQRAIEHAAEIFMWGIQGGDYDIDFRIDANACDDLSAGYRMLTGITVGCDVLPT